MKVIVLRHCHCVARFDFNRDFEFDTKEEALKKANEIVDKLKKDSCKTHKFSIVEKEDRIEIHSELNFGGLDY